MTPDRIISGGQTGADQGALVAARQLGIVTGGWMPRRFMTEAGPAPALAALYGMQEHPSSSYPARTRRNVRESDGTIWVGPREHSRGYWLTRQECDRYEKPWLDDPTPEQLRAWVGVFLVHTLNVAGPRASRDPAAHQRAAELLIAAFGGGTT